MRLLVVEDDLGVASLIQETVEAEGYALDRAESGSEATGLLQSFPYDLVVLDVMLPGQDGFEVLADLRQHKNRIPVLMLTVRDALEDRVRGLIWLSPSLWLNFGQGCGPCCAGTWEKPTTG